MKRQPITVHEVRTLVGSFHALLAIRTVEEERVTRLLTEAAIELRIPLFEWSVTRGLYRVPGENAIYETSEPLSALRHVEGTDIDAIWHFKDMAPNLENPTLRRTLREAAARFEGKRSLIVLSGDPLELPRDLAHRAVQMELALPGQRDLLEVMRSVVQMMERRQNVKLDLATADVSAILRALSGLTLNQARQAVAQAIVEDGRLDAADIPRLLRKKGALLASDGLLEFFPPDDNQSQLGGLENLKGWLQKARTGFSERARALNLKPPRGVMIVGVQGCGKSLAAKFIAREWGLPLLKLDAGRLYDKYVGESEKNLRRAMHLAESMAPAVLWIDEIEKAFAGGSSGDTDGGLSKRLFATLLTWLQEKRSDVFVIGAANDLSALPPELLRKGRFDEIFFVDLPLAHEREAIFRIHLRLRNLDPADFDIPALVAATERFSGAEIEQAVVGSLYSVIHRGADPSTQAILDEISATVPLAVSRREDVERIREFARERFVPASRTPQSSG